MMSKVSVSKKNQNFINHVPKVMHLYIIIIINNIIIITIII